MSDSDQRLERRLAAVERALDDENTPLNDGSTAHSYDTGSLETRLETLEERLDELDAAVQSVRGFLGGVSAVNERVEQRANAAIAAVERLERRLDGEEPPASETQVNNPSSTPEEYQNGRTETDTPDLRERLRKLR